MALYFSSVKPIYKTINKTFLCTLVQLSPLSIKRVSEAITSLRRPLLKRGSLTVDQGQGTHTGDLWLYAECAASCYINGPGTHPTMFVLKCLNKVRQEYCTEYLAICAPIFGNSS